MLERLLLLWLTLLSVLAYCYDEWFSRLATGGDLWDPFLASKPYLQQMFAVAMFAIGSLLPLDEVRQVARRWPTVLGGTTIQYLSMPALAYLVARLFSFEGDLFIGLIMVGCVPGAMASNVLTLAARGNVSYSLSLTTSATLLSPLVVPLTLKFLLGADAQFDVLEESWKLCWMVVLPVVGGHLLSRLWPAWHRWSQPVGKVVANLVILWIIAVVVALNRDRLRDYEAYLVVGMLVVNWAVLLAGSFARGGRRSRLPWALASVVTAGLLVAYLADRARRGESVLASGHEGGGHEAAWLLGALVSLNLLGYTIGYAGAWLLRLPEPMRRALTLEIGMQNAGLGTVLAGGMFPDRPATQIPPALYTFGCMFTGTVLARLWAIYSDAGGAPATPALEEVQREGDLEQPGAGRE